MVLYIRDCVSLCLSDETLKPVGPVYLVSMPGGCNIFHTEGKCVTCRGLHIIAKRWATLSTTPVLAQRWAVCSKLTKN